MYAVSLKGEYVEYNFHTIYSSHVHDAEDASSGAIMAEIFYCAEMERLQQECVLLRRK